MMSTPNTTYTDGMCLDIVCMGFAGCPSLLHDKHVGFKLHTGDDNLVNLLTVIQQEDDGPASSGHGVQYLLFSLTNTVTQLLSFAP